MNLYQSALFPFLQRFDAERTHNLTLTLLQLAQKTTAGRWLLRRIAGDVPRQEVHLFGLTFPNVLGVAAGFDKEAEVASGLALLGFGHVEVGTVTPWPQTGNPRPRIFRLPADRAIINRMGFPNGGMVRAAVQLRKMERLRPFVLGVSLGKQKETALAQAADDYVAVMRAVYPYADYLAVNVSSPNTPGLRELQGRRYLQELLGRLLEENRNEARKHQLRPRPLLLKIAPDLTWPELDEILAAATENGVSGMVATNTTTARSGLRSTTAAKAESGGLSGAPVAARSNEVIRYIHRHTQGNLPIIGVGGVFDSQDAQAKLDAGASLIQVYTGFVYQGPGMPGRLLRELE
jgi:dihydroorotate dehydrogenase